VEQKEKLLKTLHTPLAPHCVRCSAGEHSEWEGR
jgi:hypothetical protein